MGAILHLIRRAVASRLGQSLFVLHLVLATYAIAATAPADSWVLYDCETIPVAGRAIRVSSEPLLLKTITWLDGPAICLNYIFMIFVNVAMWLLDLRPRIYAVSWVYAASLFVLTGIQWWLIGFILQCLISGIRKPA